MAVDMGFTCSEKVEIRSIEKEDFLDGHNVWWLTVVRIEIMDWECVCLFVHRMRNMKWKGMSERK